MLTCTPVKPIFFASARASTCFVFRRFQSVTPTLNLTPLAAAYADSSDDDESRAETDADEARRRKWRRLNRMAISFLSEKNKGGNSRQSISEAANFRAMVRKNDRVIAESD
jgi:hypothetical protein